MAYVEGPNSRADTFATINMYGDFAALTDDADVTCNISCHV